jgi:hypothetical protein
MRIEVWCRIQLNHCTHFYLSPFKPPHTHFLKYNTHRGRGHESFCYQMIARLWQQTRLENEKEMK